MPDVCEIVGPPPPPHQFNNFLIVYLPKFLSTGGGSGEEKKCLGTRRVSVLFQNPRQRYLRMVLDHLRESRSRQRIFRCSLQRQNNMQLVFHISESGSEIELKHCASSKASVKSSRKYIVHLNWIRLATNPR